MNNYFKNTNYKPKYIKVAGHSISHVEEGKGDPILFIHGNPTSSFVWRNIMPKIAQSTGKRVIALDLLGFGFSDKPNIDYSVDVHYVIIEEFINKLNLKNLTIIAHDWGGPLAVRYTIDNLENVKKIMVLDTFLWNLSWDDFPKKVKLPFKLMRSFFGYLMIQVMNGFIKSFIPQNIYHKEKITKELMNDYKLPFPTIKSRKATRDFPKMIPVNGKPNSSYEFFAYIEEHINKTAIPFKMLIAKPGMGEVDMKKVEKLEQELNDFSYEYIEPSGHYMQEDQPEELVRMISFFIKEK